MNISIIGCGMYGIALALNISENKNNKVTMWTENKETYNTFKKEHSFKALLDKEIPSNIEVSNNIEEVITNKDLIIMATSAKYVRSTCAMMKPFYDKKIPICIASKGIENDTLCFLNDIVKDILKTKHIAVISGPTFAVDLINQDPVALAIAPMSLKSFRLAKQALANSHLKLRKSKDVYGIELCGSIKNVIAIASGIIEGLGYSDSTRAFLINESMHDIKELLSKLKCNPKTILSFAGIGDLVLTCSSTKSRNFSFGVVLGKKATKKEIKEYLNNNTTEGYYTLLSIKKLVKNKKIKMPIINIIYDIAINGKDPNILIDFLIKKD